jgi:hypothetical protein
VQCALGAWTAQPHARRHPLPELPAALGGQADGVLARRASGGRAGDGPEQDVAEQVVTARRDRHADLDRRRHVHLGSPARHHPAGGAGVRRVDEPGLDQLVEVEGGQRAADAHGLGSVLAGDRRVGGAQVLVQRPADGVTEHRDGLDAVQAVPAAGVVRRSHPCHASSIR